MWPELRQRQTKVIYLHSLTTNTARFCVRVIISLPPALLHCHLLLAHDTWKENLVEDTPSLFQKGGCPQRSNNQVCRHGNIHESSKEQSKRFSAHLPTHTHTHTHTHAHTAQALFQLAHRFFQSVQQHTQFLFQCKTSIFNSTEFLVWESLTMQWCRD